MRREKRCSLFFLSVKAREKRFYSIGSSFFCVYVDRRQRLTRKEGIVGGSASPHRSLLSTDGDQTSFLLEFAICDFEKLKSRSS
jgi:hypothetical protein